jgi:hypothetical protein
MHNRAGHRKVPGPVSFRNHLKPIKGLLVGHQAPQ